MCIRDSQSIVRMWRGRHQFRRAAYLVRVQQRWDVNAVFEKLCHTACLLEARKAR